MRLNQTPTALKKERKTKSQLAVEYSAHRHTIRAMCAAIGIKTNRRLEVVQVDLFYAHYGQPGFYERGE
ncbi:hypothetical protein BH24BAC1_BH24BAC1_29800 [soil metagenome]|jgi:hypothetical protein